MKIMAVDLGLARTGIAVCDELEMLASPITVINEKNESALINKIINQADILKVKLIIVGLPKNMDGTKGERAKECERIAKEIEQKSNIKTVLWDERCTTISAHNVLNVTNTRGKKRKAIVDAVAAVMILQSYLDYRKNNADKA